MPSFKPKQPLYLPHLYLRLWEPGCLPSSATSVSLLLAGCRQLRAQRPTGTLFPVFPGWARLLLPSPEGGERPVKRTARSASLTCCWLAAGPASPAWRVCVAPGYRPLPGSPRSTRKLKRRCPTLVLPSRCRGFPVCGVGPSGSGRASILQKRNQDVFQH